MSETDAITTPQEPAEDPSSAEPEQAATVDTTTTDATTDTTTTTENDDGGLWGLTSAFGGGGGWGLGGLTSAAAAPDDGGGANNGVPETGASDAELAELEKTISAAETAVTSAIWSTFSAVSEAVVGESAPEDANDSNNKKNDLLTDDDLDAILMGDDTKEEEKSKPAVETSSTSETAAAADTTSGVDVAAATEAATSAASSIWSSFGAAVSDTLSSATTSVTAATTTASTPTTTANNDTTTSSSLYDLYTSKVNRAAEWIEDLERADAQKDPYKRLKEHLNSYVTAHPRGTYEEWVELYLSEEGWDKSSAVVVDKSYYTEECPHRILWNERNYQDGIQIGDPDPKRAYVPTPSTEEERRHKPSSTPPERSDEEIITFDENTTAPTAGAITAEPKLGSQNELFKDDESNNVIVMPTPPQSGNISLGAKSCESNDEDGILVPQETPSVPS